MNAKTEKMAVVGALFLLAGCGGGTGGSAPSPSQLSLLAGNVDGPGSADGIGAAARFDHPGSAATDLSGNVYVADTTNSTIRKITPGAVVTTLAGTAGSFGSEDGIGAAARFQYPVGTATDASGNVYVADSGNDTIRKITPGGVVTTLAGTAGSSGSADGIGAAARFNTPAGIATDASGNVYVADTFNATVRKITPGGVVTTLAGTAGSSGSADGIGAAARFRYPAGTATDASGNVYVADPSDNTIRKITPGGVVTTLAGTAGSSGAVDGIGAAARFFGPISTATDASGNVYVADSWNSTIRKITPDGVVTTPVGFAGRAGFVPGSLPGGLINPQGVAVIGTSLYAVMGNGVVEVTSLP